MPRSAQASARRAETAARIRGERHEGRTELNIAVRDADFEGARIQQLTDPVPQGIVTEAVDQNDVIEGMATEDDVAAFFEQQRGSAATSPLAAILAPYKN